jgi:hypothetical protein
MFALAHAFPSTFGPPHTASRLCAGSVTIIRPALLSLRLRHECSFIAKKHAVNEPRVKEGIHNVIVYCKANRERLVIRAIDVILKQEQKK